MSELSTVVQSALTDCLRVRRNESVLILADEPLSNLGYAFHEVAKVLSKNPLLVVIPEITNHGSEPPKGVAAMMIESDVIVLITSRSLSHTKTRRKASQRGARIASLPGVTKASLLRTMIGDYRDMISKSRKVADILTIGRTARLTNPAGTDLTFSLVRMKGHADTGMIHENGKFSNLPAGEGSTAPAAESTNGVLVVDGSFPEIGKLKIPIRMTVKNGYVVRITGCDDADTIRTLLRPFGRPGRNIAEIGIGTNPYAKFTGCTLEDEKVMGNIHVALGNNISFGGKIAVRCHFDAVLLKSTLVIDGKTVVENGILQV